MEAAASAYSLIMVEPVIYHTERVASVIYHTEPVYFRMPIAGNIILALGLISYRSVVEPFNSDCEASMNENEEASVLIAFRAPRPLAAAAEAAAAREGLTRSDIARRALIYALRGNNAPAATAHGTIEPLEAA